MTEERKHAGECIVVVEFLMHREGRQAGRLHAVLVNEVEELYERLKDLRQHRTQARS
jgi:hypothetical protein